MRYRELFEYIGDRVTVWVVRTLDASCPYLSLHRSHGSSFFWDFIFSHEKFVKILHQRCEVF